MKRYGDAAIEAFVALLEHFFPIVICLALVLTFIGGAWPATRGVCQAAFIWTLIGYGVCWVLVFVVPAIGDLGRRLSR